MTDPPCGGFCRIISFRKERIRTVAHVSNEQSDYADVAFRAEREAIPTPPGAKSWCGVYVVAPCLPVGRAEPSYKPGPKRT